MNRNITLLLVGLVAGIIAGGLGFSTAIFLIPALLGLGLLKSYKMTIGTTILTILPPLSLLAFMKYYKEGLVDVHAALLLMISGFIGGGIGANIAIEDASGPTLAYTMSAVYGILAVVWLYLARTPIVELSRARRTKT
jgi:uncharacterized membrane protein YfcA